MRQLRLLFQPAELRGLSRDLRETIPPLARVNRRTIPLLNQNRALSKCTNDVLVPFANTPIPTGEPGSEPADSPDADPNAITSSLDFEYDPDSSGQPFAEQSGRAFVGLSGESRIGDANNEFFRANFKLDTVATFFRPGGAALDDTLLALGAFEENARPAPTPYEQGDPQLSYRRPDFRPDFPCENSVTPDLRAPSTVGTADPADQILGTVDELRQQLEDLGVLPPLPEAPIPTSSEVNEIAGQVEREASQAERRPAGAARGADRRVRRAEQGQLRRRSRAAPRTTMAAAPVPDERGGRVAVLTAIKKHLGDFAALVAVSRSRSAWAATCS